MPALCRPFRIGRNRGVTLIESVLFISIALGLIVGGISFFAQADAAARTNEAVRNITAITAEVRSLYLKQESFADLGNGVVLSSGSVPKTLSVTGTTISNEFGGTYTLAPGTTAETFTLTSTSLPKAICTRLLPYDAGGNGVAGAFIEGAEVAGAEGYAPVPETAGAVGPGAAATACAGATNDVRFTFGR